jgi:hypothetical protein
VRGRAIFVNGLFDHHHVEVRSGSDKEMLRTLPDKGPS